MQVMHRNFKTMASRVTRELESISSSSENTHSLEIDRMHQYNTGASDYNA